MLNLRRSGGDSMAWPYHFVDLDSEQTLLRRKALDRYGTYAQLSPLVPLLVYSLCRLVFSVCAPSGKKHVSTSNAHLRPHLAGLVTKRWRRALWWLEGEVGVGWGLRVHWILGALWASWLIFLSLRETGNDYLHVTKRFGIVAASQFPMHYLLSMKSLCSPLAFVLRSSHEQLNPYHRISGRIIYSLLIFHGGLYMNFYIQKGILWERLTSQAPFLGFSSLSLITLLVSSSICSVRHWSYRVFFVLHLVIGVSILPVLYFHASPLRLFSIESFVIFLIDILARKLDTVTESTAITLIQSTNLVELSVQIPPSKINRFMSFSGQHVYLSIPPQSWPDKSTFLPIRGLLYNPFTVADITPSGITIVLRIRHGPITTALDRLACLPKLRPQINIEGPYGGSKHYPEFSKEFDRVLLVAGGVGATFIIPVYHSIRKSLQGSSRDDQDVKLIWAMTSAAERIWAKNLDGDKNVGIYMTGSGNADAVPLQGDRNIETLNLHTVNQSVLSRSNLQRPNLGEIVDETFRHRKEDRIAVIACGPEGMVRELRWHVGRWVQMGRSVWWHNEAFGW